MSNRGRPSWDDAGPNGPASFELWAVRATPIKAAPEFLRLIALGHTVTHACRVLGVSRAGMYDMRDRSPEFEAAWLEAESAGADAIVEEIRRRAIDGVDRLVFYQGVALNEKQREYSDALLLALAKAKLPEAFRERYDVNNHVDVRLDHATEITEARRRAGITIDATPTSVTRIARDLEGDGDA